MSVDVRTLMADLDLPQALLLKKLDDSHFELCVPGIDGGYGGWLAEVSDSTVSTPAEARAFKALCQLLATAPQLLSAGIAAAGALQAAVGILQETGHPKTAEELSALLVPLIDAIGQATRKPT